MLVLGLGISLSAHAEVPEYRIASGSWVHIGDRLFQTDPNARLAKVNMLVPQSGPMIYEFNIRYEGGTEDGHGGFGIHLFANNVSHTASWGSGTSYLLWLNYDSNPITAGIHRGFSAQLYRSYSNSRMDLVESFDLNEFADLLTWENLSDPIPVVIWANGYTGEVRIYDPTDPDMRDYFYLFLPTTNLSGDWISIRTNGLRLSLGLD